MTSFNVAGLLQQPPGAYRDHHLRDHYLNLGPDLELAGPLSVDLRLQRTNRGVLARGQASASLRRTCARCLDPYVDDVTVPISEEFVPSVDTSGAPAPEPAEGEEVLRIDDHHEIDLDPILREELLLTEPMHPLCRPDCPGLCAQCGASLSGGPHDHGPEEVDPRLAALARLLDEVPPPD